MGPRLRIPGSIRFRLTAWYALLLAVVLAVLGVFVLRMTEERVRVEGDERLEKTAQNAFYGVGSANRSLFLSALSQVDDRPYSFKWDKDFDSFFRERFDDYENQGLVIQLIDVDSDVVYTSSQELDQPLLPVPRDAWEKTAFGSVTANGDNLRVVRIAAVVQDRGKQWPVGAVVVGQDMDVLYGTLDALERTLLTTSVVGLALAIVGGWLLAGRALRPVDRVTATAAQIAAGDGTAASLATRLRVPDTGDEIARLSRTFNAMLDRLEVSFQAQQRFVADASHELRTPLTAIRGNVEVLGRQLAALQTSDARKEDLEAAIADVQRESARMGRLIDDLLFLVRTDAPGAETQRPVRPVRLDEVARDAVRTAGALATGQRLEVVAPAAVTVRGDADRLEQLLLILLDNALRHTPAGKEVTVEVAAPRGPGQPARVIVQDEGEGIAPEHLPHLFDRFYRADGARGRATGGTGLGLAIAQAIVRGHGGEISVSSTPGEGSAFVVSLPALGAEVAAPLAPKALPARAVGERVEARTG